MNVSKSILIFQCNTILKPDVKEQIRKKLKEQVDEGVVFIDDTLEYIGTVVPEALDCEIVLLDKIEEE